MQTHPFISLYHISIRRGDSIVFEGTNWEIANDQHWAVIGPNGAGKSTLMQALCGSLPIAGGEIIYHFMRENGHRPLRDQIAHVSFQAQASVVGRGEDPFYQARWNAGASEDRLSADEYLSYTSVRSINPFHVVEFHPDDGFAERRQRTIEQLELGPLLERNIWQLSNGERRKLTIARALLQDPRLLILDSPFAGLDEHSRARLAENLQELLRGEMRVILVGTDRDEIPDGITHVLHVRENRVVAQPSVDLPGFENLAGLGRAPDRADLPGFQNLVGLGQPRPPSAGQALVQMQDVDVSYNGTPVLQQINWTVREDEHWALVGPNGAGKTTLLSLILADNPQAYANDITLFGKRRGSGESIWEIKSHIGWVAPELQLYYPRNATCLDVVCSGWFDSVGLYRECSPEQRAAARIWLERYGLAASAKTSFAHISEGEQRLVLLARALVKSPRLLILDEPCQALDAVNRDRVLAAIDRVTSVPGTSMIYVTHRADELPQSITHILRLNEGRAVEQGKRETNG